MFTYYDNNELGTRVVHRITLIKISNDHFLIGSFGREVTMFQEIQGW